MADQPESAFRDARALRLFPSFVWRAELAPALAQPINDAIVLALGRIGAPLAGLERGESWQSGHELHRLREFAPLRGHIEAAADKVLDHLRIARARSALTITGCWANVNAPGARHGTHSHPNNFLSGVYYARTHAGADTINFHDPRPQCAIIRPPVEAITADNTDLVVVGVADGTLLLFPAWLQHSVDANRGADIRVSISFNLMFAAYAETLSKPMWEGGRRRM